MRPGSPAKKEASGNNPSKASAAAWRAFASSCFLLRHVVGGDARGMIHKQKNPSHLPTSRPSRLKCPDFNAVAGNTSTGIETSPKEMLLRDIAQEGIVASLRHVIENKAVF